MLILANDINIRVNFDSDADSLVTEIRDLNRGLNSLNDNIRESADLQEEAARDAIRALNNQQRNTRAQIRSEEQLNDAIGERIRNTAALSDSLVSNVQSSFSRIKEIAIGTLSALGLEDLFGDISQSMSEALENASSISEAENLISSVYASGAKSLIEWSDANATAYGLANSASKQYLSSLTGIMHNLGVEDAYLGNMSQNYVKLIGDLASAYNSTTSEVFESVRSAITGSTETLKKYGIVLNETNAQQFLNEQGINATYRSLDSLSKQYVNYAYILKTTESIQGDYSKTFDSFSNTIKTLKNDWQNFLTLLGQYAIPILKPILDWLRTLIAYASAVLKYLGNINGWEIYQSDAIDNSKLIVENTEDAADAQTDVTNAVEATNKAMKKGVKLLDLYTLDFSDSASAASSTSDINTPEIPGISSELDKLANFEYNAPESILPDIDVDANLVQKIGDALSFAIKKLNDFKDDFVNFLEAPIPEKITTAGGLLLNLLAGKMIFDTIKGVVSDLSLSKKALSGFSKSIGSAFLLGISAVNIGQGTVNDNIAQQLGGGLGLAIGGVLFAKNSGLYKLMSEFTYANSNYLFESVSTKFAGGLLAGLTVFLASAAIANISAILTMSNNAVENMKKVAEGSVTATDIFKSTELAESMQAFVDKTESASVAFDDVTGSSENAMQSVTDFLNESTRLPEGETSAEYLDGKLDDLSKTFESLNAEYADYIENSAKPLSDAFVNSLVGPGGILEGSDKLGNSLRNTLNAMLDLQASDLSGATSQLSVLLAKDNKTEDDLERIKYLQDKISAMTDADDTTLSTDIAKKFADADLTSISAVYDYARDLEKEYFDSLDATVEDYQRQINVANITLTSVAATDEEKKEAQSTIDFYTNLINTIDLQKKTIGSEIESQVEDLRNSFSEEAVERIPKVVAQYVVETEFEYRVDKDKLSASAESVLAKEGDTLETYLEKLGFTSSDYKDWSIEKKQNVIVSTEVLADTVLYGNIDDIKFDASQDFIGKDTLKRGISQFFGEQGMNVQFTESGIEYEYAATVAQSLGFTFNPPTSNELNDAKASLEKSIEAVSEYSAKSAGEMLGDDVADETAGSIGSEKSEAKIEEAASNMLANGISAVENPEEAEIKGSDIANSLVNGIREGFNTATSKGSSFMQSVDTLTSVLTGIPKAFEDGFKSSVNSIAGYINYLANGLKEQTSKLNLPEGNITIAQLYSSLKSSNFKIPMLANGGVIPANNPFLAVLGDQRRGLNIEAPVTVIQDAVRDVINEPEQQDNISINVYIGDREIRDFVIDTVTSNNITVG